MNDDHFFDLATKSIAKQASPEEQAELNALMAAKPKLQQEFKRIQADVALAKEVLPMLDAMGATEGKVPEYARERLRTKVRETFKNVQPQPRPKPRIWMWLGLASSIAVIVLAATFFFKAPETVIQVAMLDSVGGVRGSTSNLVGVIEQTWKGVQQYSEAADLKRWMGDWPQNSKIVKIVYDRDAQEVRVAGRGKGKTPFEKTFPVSQEKDLQAVLQDAQKYVKEQLER